MFSASNFGCHPEYGWYTRGFRDIGYGCKINERCEVIGSHGKLRPASHGNILLGRPQRGFRVTHLCLRAFFPGVNPQETVDHQDEDFTNNNIFNLKWMSRAENTRKSNAKQPRRGQSKKWRPVWLLDGPRGKKIKRFRSRGEAATFVGAQRIYQSVQSFEDEQQEHVPVRGHWFAPEYDPDLPGETWTTSDALDTALKQTAKTTKVRVSNLGRVHLSSGIKTFGNRGGHGHTRALRYVDVVGKAWPVHQLIYMGHTNLAAPAIDTRLPNGKLARIRRKAPHVFDADGCHSNAIAELYLGPK